MSKYLYGILTSILAKLRFTLSYDPCHDADNFTPKFNSCKYCYGVPLKFVKTSISMSLIESVSFLQNKIKFGCNVGSPPIIVKLICFPDFFDKSPINEKTISVLHISYLRGKTLQQYLHEKLQLSIQYNYMLIVFLIISLE